MNAGNHLFADLKKESVHLYFKLPQKNLVQKCTK